MKLKKVDYVRANDFDQWVGKIQTQHTINLRRGKSILDVGCGIGQYTPLFLEHFNEVYGLDSSAELLEVARSNNKIINYIQGNAETFELQRKFDTINMNMLLEHVDNPINVLQTCKNHLSTNGVIIAQVPNSTSVTRKIGVLMGIIESTGHMSEKEINFFGHQRVYTLDSLSNDCTNAGLKILESGGILYKPLPNTDLYKLCKSKGENWTNKFLQALVDYGKDKATDCANIYIVCN